MRQPPKITLPRAITGRDEGLWVDWDGAGHAGLVPARELRLGCPCAECVEEMTGRPLLDPAGIPEHIRPVAVELVGAYGLKVRWSVGLGTVIFPVDRLWATCPCGRPEHGG